MSDSGSLVVFDHHFLAKAVTDSASPESEALDALRRHCPNKLLFNDSQGRLQEIYEELLGPRFPFIFTELLTRLGTEDKMVARRQRWPVGEIPRRQIRYWQLFGAALAVRPTYIVTGIDVWRRHAEQFEDEYSTRILYPDEFTNLLGQIP